MRVIVLEGINAVGKTTVAQGIRDTLLAAGRPCLAVDPAGFGPIGQSLRKHIVQIGTVSTANYDTMLFAALRMEGALGILESIKAEPSTTVVLERWALALIAYGDADGARSQLASELSSVLGHTLAVHVTVLLDLSGAKAYARIEKDPDKNRFESKGPEYLDGVAQSYRRFAALESDVATVDASEPPSTILRNVWSVLATKWEDMKGLA